MKTYRHLYEKFLNDENYYLAVRNATRHKGGKRRKHRKAKFFRDHADELKDDIMSYAANFRPVHHERFEIYDGIRRKKRSIVVPTMREQIVHHMIINVMKPIFMKSMYEHSYGSIPDRGAHLAKKRVKRWIRNGGRKCKYVLKMDVRKFFDSVPHDTLKMMLRRIISDDRFMMVLDAVIDSGDGNSGIPIGFYTSQWFANFYLTGLDHEIKEGMKACFYVRYMDDMVVFGSSKRSLHRIREKVERYLNDVLGLEMKADWQVFLFDYVRKSGVRVGRDLDFMGFRFFRDIVILRRTIMLRITRKARHISKKSQRRGKTVHDARQMLSYLGWIDSTDTYGMYKSMVKPFICFRQLKKQVGRYQRRLNLA